VATLLW